MSVPLLVRRREIEGDMGIVEVQIVVGVIKRERHVESIHADVEVEEQRIAQRRGVCAACR